MFVNVNLDSVNEVTPKVHKYNNKSNKFIQNINMEYGLLLEFTVLEILEVSNWVETFQVLTNLNGHQETQPAPISTTNLPPQVNISLKHQQDEINRLMKVAQQWSAEGPHQYHHTQENYNTSRGRSCSTPNTLPVHDTMPPQHFEESEHKRYSYQDRRYQHHCSQEPDQRRYPNLHLNLHQTVLMLIQLLQW